MKRPWRVEYTSGPVENWAVMATYRTKIVALISASMNGAAHPGITYRVRKHVEFESAS